MGDSGFRGEGELLREQPWTFYTLFHHDAHNLIQPSIPQFHGLRRVSRGTQTSPRATRDRDRVASFMTGSKEGEEE